MKKRYILAIALGILTNLILKSFPKEGIVLSELPILIKWLISVSYRAGYWAILHMLIHVEKINRGLKIFLKYLFWADILSINLAFVIISVIALFK